MGLRSLVSFGPARRLATAGLASLLLAGVSLAPVAGQPLPDDLRTIYVTGTGVATAPAETARIQFLVANYGDAGLGMMPAMPEMETPGTEDVQIVEGEVVVGTPEASMDESGWVGYAPLAGQLTDEDMQSLVDAVIEAGAPAGAVTAQTGASGGGYIGPGAAGYGLVEVLLPDPTQEQVRAIVDAAQAAANEAMLLVEQIGVEYNVADCAPLMAAAQAAAADDARARAEELAQHFGGSAGAPVQVADYSSFLQPAGGGSGCPLSQDVMMGMYGPSSDFNTPPYSALAPAEARVVVQLAVTYELELASQ